MKRRTFVCSKGNGRPNEELVYREARNMTVSIPGNFKSIQSDEAVYPVTAL